VKASSPGRALKIDEAKPKWDDLRDKQKVAKAIFGYDLMDSKAIENLRKLLNDPKMTKLMLPELTDLKEFAEKLLAWKEVQFIGSGRWGLLGGLTTGAAMSWLTYRCFPESLGYSYMWFFALAMALCAGCISSLCAWCALDGIYNRCQK